ncbi:MAG: hypothetical protein ACO1PI_09255 [Bacteroidota bacterium]
MKHQKETYNQPEIPSLRRRKIERAEQRLRNMGYSEKRIAIIKDYLYALCHTIIKAEIDKQ